MTESEILRIWNGPTSQCNRTKILQFAADYREKIVAEIIDKNAPEIEKINAALAKGQPAAVSESDDEQALRIAGEMDQQEPVLYWHKESPDPDEWDVFDPAERCPRCTPLYLHPARLIAEREKGQEPVAWRVELSDSVYLIDDIDDAQAVDDLTNHNATLVPLYAAPVAPDCVSVPKTMLESWTWLLDAAVDESETDTLRGELRAAEITISRLLLAAHKEPK